MVTQIRHVNQRKKDKPVSEWIDSRYPIKELSSARSTLFQMMYDEKDDRLEKLMKNAEEANMDVLSLAEFGIELLKTIRENPELQRLIQ